MSIITSILDCRPTIETAILEGLPTTALPGFVRLSEAMRYSVSARAKRIRPLLCIASYSLFELEWHSVLPLCCALEWIHTYSLIHDDLPAMDNDDYRRGVLTSHRRYDEVTAILSGDALNTYAFEWLAQELPKAFSPERCLPVISGLAHACGVLGMAGGQMLDMLAQHQVASLESVLNIHRAKTGALIEASVVLPAHLVGATSSVISALCEFGADLGLLFQVIDDILDETSTSAELGKTARKDASQAKLTVVRVMGLSDSERFAQTLQAQVMKRLEVLSQMGLDVVHLRELVVLVANRRY